MFITRSYVPDEGVHRKIVHIQTALIVRLNVFYMSLYYMCYNVFIQAVTTCVRNREKQLNALRSMFVSIKQHKDVTFDSAER